MRRVHPWILAFVDIGSNPCPHADIVIKMKARTPEYVERLIVVTERVQGTPRAGSQRSAIVDCDLKANNPAFSR